MLLKPITQTETNTSTFHNFSISIYMPSSHDNRSAFRKDKRSKNISHFTAPSHFGQASLHWHVSGVFTAVGKQRRTRRRTGRQTAGKHRVAFCAVRSDKVEYEKNVKYPKPEPNPCVVTQGSRRRPRAVVFPLPPLVVTAWLHRKRCIVLLPPTASEQELQQRSSM